ncbi:LOW QUALITY PROTEIN: UDP-glycosyltransferase UGT5-like [Culicoides brevitarsis]|uniref:LOW QUALITY PROTEIN: UDP-glycosyltransferase UGT5-like n=1 Tax=Culicoides brevitarsis TaxID=469753 RepID=UPI00307BF869
MDMKSHYLIAQNFLKELAKAGHNVTVFTGFKSNNLPQNYREVVVNVPSLDEFKKSVTKDGSFLNLILSVNSFQDYSRDCSRAVVWNDELQALINSKTEVDCVVMGFSESPVLLGISKVLKAPVVMTSTQKLAYFLEYYIGAFAHDSFVTNPMLTVDPKITFFIRMKNTVVNWVFRILMRFNFWTQEDTYKELFPSVEGSLWDAISDSVQLMLVNSHFSLDRPMPYMTNMIEVGGMQISDEINDLPNDLQKFMDSATDGVIYFCMGSTLKLKELDSVKKNSIIEGLKKTKLPVIIKWDDESTIQEFSSKTKFFASNWLPQNDILANPKVKAYVTHGGLLSTTEAVYHGVPIVGIPIFGDQSNNIKKFMDFDMAVQVDYATLTAESLSSAINHVITDKKFSQNAKSLSQRFRDRPMTPTKTAKYWVEYVMRHKNQDFMKSPAMKLSLIEYFNLDVYLMILGAVLISCCFGWKVSKCIFGKVWSRLCRICRKDQKEVFKEKKS